MHTLPLAFILKVEDRWIIMTRMFRLALAQINTTVGDIPGNTALMLEIVERARESQVDLLAFP